MQVGAQTETAVNVRTDVHKRTETTHSRLVVVW